MRILFGVMSAVQPAETAAALCDAVGLSHPILIQHDFSQQPGYLVERPNVDFVPNPVSTGWGEWGFVQGVEQLLRTAMARSDWDFFQLVSPTCLPIRPLAELEAYLASTGADYFVDGVDIGTEARFLMSHGWRAYARKGRLRQRVLFRARRWYLGKVSPMANEAGISFPTASLANAGGVASLKASLGLGITRLAQRGVGFDHVFSDSFPCYAGTSWFGASRGGCATLLARMEDPTLVRYFREMYIPSEMLFPTLLLNSKLKVAPAIHFISRFEGARPSWIGTADLDEVLASGRFFARKFPEDINSDVRGQLACRLSR